VSGAPSSRRLPWLAPLGVGLLSGACLYGPPLAEPPEALDFPPIVGNVSPDPAVVRRLNRDEGEVVTLLASDIRDRNTDDAISFQLALLLSAAGNEDQPLPFTFAVGQLEPSGDFAENGATIYDPLSRTFDPCDSLVTLVLAQSESNGVTVRLRLEDEIPEDQRDELGLDSHVVDITWSFSVVGECPL
jgi:hypothetical protein